MKTITITLEQEKYEALTFYLKKNEKDAPSNSFCASFSFFFR